MKLPHHTVLFSVLIFFIPILSSAQQSHSAKDYAIVDSLLAEIPFESRLEAAPKDIEMQFAQNPLGLPSQKNERMIQLFAEGFVIDSLMRDVESIFNSQYSSEHSGALKSWLNSESTQKVHKAEEALNTLQGARQRVVRMYEMEQDPPTATREDIILSLINATSSADIAIASQSILFRSIVSAFSILSDQRTFSESQIDGIVNNYRMEIESQVEDDLKQQYLLMYYDLDNETLKEYTSFFNSDAGVWLGTTASAAMKTAYQNASDRFIESVEIME